MNLLLTGPGFEPRHLDYARSFGFEPDWQLQPTHQKLASIAPTLTHYVLGGDERLDATFFARAPNLRRISFVGGDAAAFVDIAAAESHRVSITTTPDITTSAVAEHTIGLLLGLTRSLFAHIECAKAGRALAGPTRELSELRIGIVGLGRIGEAVARLLSNTFGARVFYFSRHRRAQIEAELGIEWTSLPTLFRTCDAISLHAPSQPGATAIIDRDIFTQTKRGIFLVNTAPPTLVAASALREAIVNGTVAAAAFDGYWTEPLPSPADDTLGLLTLSDTRFVVTPHIAAKTTSAWPRMIDAAIANICRGRA